MDVINLADMFFQKGKSHAAHTGYMYKKDDHWHNVTFQEAVNRTEKIAAGLASLGVKKGDKIALMSANCLEWAITDYAALSLGAVLVPLYPTLLAQQVQYIINDCEAKVVIVSEESQVDKVNAVKMTLKSVKHFFVFEADKLAFSDYWKDFNALAMMGTEFLKRNPVYVSGSIKNVNRSDVATIIYTSGTTGEPKGAVLTHDNFISNVQSVTEIFKVYPEDIFLSFLPLSHIFERTAGQYFACYNSSTVAYAESIDLVPQNILEVRPTIMVSVPRLYEKIHSRIIDAVESGPALKKKLFYWALGIGHEYAQKIKRKEVLTQGFKIKRNLAHKLVFSKLQARVGGRLRLFVSGGAPLAAEIGEFFESVGLLILEGYGLTETSPGICFNRPDNYKFGTVGSPLPGVEVKIADDGEILSRGAHIMKGYFKKDAETKEVIDNEGWFHTGDIGHLDSDGFLKITDRKKNILVTAGGKNIAPQPVENIMITSKYFEQFVMIGDKRKFCTAVVVLSQETMQKWADAKGLSYSNYAELVKLPGVNELVRAEIDRLSGSLASYETIKKFVIASAPFSIDSDELTPSLKVKRKIVEEKYSAEIEALYAS